MFDNSSELTLVSSIFAKRNNLPFKEATHTLVDVGGQAITYKAGKDGKVYTIPLVDTNGETVYVKAFSVKKILNNKVRREKLDLNPMEFIHISQEVLQETAKSLPRKHLDVLVSNINLGLCPVCNFGFKFPDCNKGCCLFKSRFRSGYVPVGSFDSHTKDKVPTVKN